MSTQTSKSLSVEEASKIAKEAYIFGLPLVYIGLTVEVSTNVSKPEGMRAPVNQFANVREFPDAANNPVVGMNVDTLYSLGHLDLSAGPLVLSIPEMGDRFWIMQLVDAWNDVPAAPGSRTVGGKGGNFAIVGPGWNGSLPAGLTKLNADTNLIIVAGRTYTAGKADYENVHALQDKYRITPLSKWGTDYKPPASVDIKPGVDGKTPVPKQVFAMSAEEFFNRLNGLLVENPARPADAPLIARMEKLGIKAGAKFRMSDFDKDVQVAISEAMLAGQLEIKEGHPKMGEEVNNWRLARDLGKYGTKYSYRAIWTYFGVGGNLVEDACYPTCYQDGEGNKLSGANKYELHFSKLEIPPVKSFWSITMYDKDSYLVPNPINRYSLGDRDKLNFGSDGSLTIYVQHDPPEEGKKANWLPAPKDEIFLALRLYGPKEEVINGKWAPPAVKKVK